MDENKTTSALARIRVDVELAKARIVETIDALGYKVDVPTRIGDMLSATASNVTARNLQALPSRSATPDGTPEP